MKFKNVKMFVVMAITAVFVVVSWMPAIAPTAKAFDFACPPGLKCKLLTDVGQCLQGEICIPAVEFMASGVCPPIYVCFYTMPIPAGMMGSTATSNTASSTTGSGTSTVPATNTPGPSVSYLDRYSGPPGATVNIYGTYFGTTSSLVFGGGSAGYSLITPTFIATSHLSFNVPSTLSAGIYGLSVSNPGTLASNPVTFVVTSGTGTTASTTGTTSSTNSSNNTTTTNTNTTSTSDNTSANNASNYYTQPYYNSSYYNTNPVSNTYAPPARTGKFAFNDRVRTTDNLRVRGFASIQGTLLGTQPLGSTGTVRSGSSIASDGYTWWSINYDSGADGWSAENYLELSNSTNSTSGSGGSSVPAYVAPAPAYSNSNTVTTASACFSFSRDLSFGAGLGDRAYLSKDVGYLQAAFITEGFTIADYETKGGASFGASTLAAAVKFQDKYGITPDAGYVGPITRTKLNALYGGCR